MVLLATGPDTPRPIFSPLCSGTPIMLIEERKALDSWMRVSSRWATVGAAVNLRATSVTPLSRAMLAR
ncbi:hypothetical protein D3C78_1397390 [compost metagenome]